MNISIICPIYNGEKYIEDLNSSLINQEKIDQLEIRYILTEGSDSSEDILKNLNANYTVVKKEEFSHSLCREKEAFKSNGDILVFITQDIIIKDSLWLYKLTIGIEKGICDASFSKQICDNKSIERYTRMKNYPDESRIVSKDDIKTLGIMTYFFSDAASAIRKSVFVKLKGYDKKDLLTNEDMYISYKLINNGYKIKYVADSVVIHSHDYSYKSLLKRYFDQGVFLKQHEYISSAGANEGAVSLLKYVIKHSLKEKNLKTFYRIVPNFATRFIGNKLGYNYKKLNKKLILNITSNKNYWIRNK